MNSTDCRGIISQPLGNLITSVFLAIDHESTTGVNLYGFRGQDAPVVEKNGIRVGRRKGAEENQDKE